MRGDITDPSSCQRALPAEVDAVFHLAGDTSHWKLGDARQTEVNVEGTRNVVAAAVVPGRPSRLTGLIERPRFLRGSGFFLTLFSRHEIRVITPGERQDIG